MTCGMYSTIFIFLLVFLYLINRASGCEQRANAGAHVRAFMPLFVGDGDWGHGALL